MTRTILKWAIRCAVALCCLGCSKGGSEPSPTPTPQPETDKITLSSASAQVVSSDAGTFTLTFTTNTAWTVTSNASWCKVSPASGSAGTVTVTVTLDPNEDYDERKCSIAIKAGSAAQSVSVTQKQKDALILTAGQMQAEAGGGTVTVEVKANIEYTITSDSDWITEISTRALTSRTHTFQIAENTGFEAREGHIIIRSGRGEEAVTVTQDGITPRLTISKEEIVAEAAESAQTVEISANIPVEVSFGADWLSGEETADAGTYAFVVSENASPDQREADIRFFNDEHGLSCTLHVTQVQKDALVIAKDSYEFGPDGGTLELETSTNVNLTYDIAEDSGDWIKYVTTKALRSETLVFSIAPAEVTVNRTGAITVSGGDLSFTVTVRQISRELDEAVRFEDPEFKKYCTERFDSDGDGEISFREALAVESIDVRTDNIRSLAGIEAFKNLRSLNAGGSDWGAGLLESLDLSQNTALQYIIVPNNHLKSLTLPKGAPLTDIVAYCNEISSFRLGDYETLETVSIGANGNVAELELPRKADGLRVLYIDNDNVSSVDISAYGALESFYCHGNPLTSLNIRSNPNISDLNCNCPSMKVLFVTPGQTIDGVTVNRSSDRIHENTVIWTGDPADYHEIIDVESVTLDASGKTLKIGESFTLTASVLPDNATDKTVTWATSNPAVATVSETGEVTAIAEGTAVITATADTKSATCTITVEIPYIPVESVMLDASEKTLKVGESFILTATVLPDNATDKTVTWTTSNPAVATVSETGKVRAIAEGTAVITASAGHAKGYCKVTVKKENVSGGHEGTSEIEW